MKGLLSLNKLRPLPLFRILCCASLFLLISISQADKTFAATVVLEFDANDIDGDGVDNAGDICNDGSTTWDDQSSNDNDSTLTGFAAPCDASSGWDGDGSAADPFRLKFDGSNDEVDTGSNLTGGYKSIVVWFQVTSMPTSVDTVFAIGAITTRLNIEDYKADGNYNGHNYDRGTGITQDDWYMFAMTNDGATTKHFLNGIEYASIARVNTTTSQTVDIGHQSGSSNFIGAINKFIVYSDTLTDDEVWELYEQDRERFEADPGVTRIDRIVPAVGDVAGGETITIYGFGFTGTTGITIGGDNCTSINVVSDGKVQCDTPAKNAGYYSVAVTSPSGTDTNTTAFRMTNSPVDNLLIWMDPKNIDGAGSPGADAATNDLWIDLVAGPHLGFQDFTFSGDGSAGWAGDGSAGDPYRIMFDGTNDEANFGNTGSSSSYVLWINPGLMSSPKYLIGRSISRASIRYGGITVAYNNGGIGTGTGVEEWHLLAYTNDGATTSVYLDGVFVGSESKTAESSGGTNLDVGHTSSSGNFEGSMGSIRVYTDALSESEIQTIYFEELSTYKTDPGTPRIDRIVPAGGDLAGGTTLEIYGVNLGGTTSVNFGANAGTSITNINDNKITVDTPAGDAIGCVDVEITATDGNSTNSKSFLYTESPVDNLEFWVNAALIDAGGGTQGDGATKALWSNMIESANLGLYNFTLPGDGSSGWDGSGTSSDIYRLEYSGSDLDDVTWSGEFIPTDGIQSISLWVNVDTTSSTDYLFGLGTSTTYARINSTTLSVEYNNGVTKNTTLSQDAWHHIAFSNNGTTTTFYLDGTSFATDTKATMSATAQGFQLGGLGGSTPGSSSMNGAISDFRMYNDELTSGEITTIVNEGEYVGCASSNARRLISIF